LYPWAYSVGKLRQSKCQARKSFVSGHLYLLVMTKKCPTCGSSDEVRIIQWGMPSEEPDPSKYVAGGCIVPGNKPDFHCLRCTTDFYRNKNEWRSRFIWANFDGISIRCRNCFEWFPADQWSAQHKCENLANPQAEKMDH
jgi:hypothetical protein